MFYIVTGSYQTWGGNLGTFRFELLADDEDHAIDKAIDKIAADKRRRYMGGLDGSCALATNY